MPIRIIPHFSIMGNVDDTVLLGAVHVLLSTSYCYFILSLSRFYTHNQIVSRIFLTLQIYEIEYCTFIVHTNKQTNSVSRNFFIDL